MANRALTVTEKQSLLYGLFSRIASCNGRAPCRPLTGGSAGGLNSFQRKLNGIDFLKPIFCYILITGFY